MGSERGKRSDKVVGAAGGSGGGRPVLPVWIGAILVVLFAGYLITSDRTPAPAGSPDGNRPPAGTPAARPARDPGEVPGAAEDPEEAFVLAVLADSRTIWEPILQATGSSYAPPAQVLFRGEAPAACGVTDAGTGPFYCPAERALYVDIDFLKELRQRLQAQSGNPSDSKAAGDFAAAYVIAHEVGHHLQNLMGTTELARQLLEAPPGEEEVPPIALMVELQADCYAGMWAQRTAAMRNFLEQGDPGEALTLASAIGNERLLGRPRGTVMPDPLTHGSAEQRARWFRTGLGAGDIQACETFAAPEL